MAYADDDLLSARTKAALLGALQECEGVVRNLGLRINEEKTIIRRLQGTKVWGMNSLPVKASNTWKQQ
jgi:hypothetical protein